MRLFWSFFVPPFIELLMKMQGLLNEVVWDSSISARLLIVDDDAFLRTTLRQQLAGEGLNEVFEASTLLEVFEKLPDAKPALGMH